MPPSKGQDIDDEDEETKSTREKSNDFINPKSSIASASFVDESHPECKFCKKQFDDISES